MKNKYLQILAVAPALLLLALLATISANAHGFPWFFKHRKPLFCNYGHPVAVSFYRRGHRTANGEVFDANGNTAASRTLAFGVHVTLINPRNDRWVTVRINDRGPFGIAHELGIYLDLAYGAAKRLGLRETSWVCALP